MATELKHLKKGSVVKFKELLNQVKKIPLTSEEREELKEVFKKKESPPETAEKIKPQKIAKPDQDIGV